MNEPQDKTLDEHREFLCEMVKLQLWFVHHWLAEHPDESLAKVLHERVDIFRKTDLNAGPSKNTMTAGDFTLPAWVALEAELQKLHEKLRGAAPECFEKAAWPVLEPLVLARVERDFHEGNALDNFQCGSLRYNNSVKGEPPTVFFHIGNRIAPRSIFADPEYLPDCLRQLMRATGEKLGAKALGTSTWLNSYPRWLALFPEEWQRNLSPTSENVGWSQSHWGQFVSARGTFNHKHGQILRETGRLPFPSRAGSCTFKALTAHLDRLRQEYK